MERVGRQRNLLLILARSFAAQLATAVFLVDAEGTVIYFNEAAERLLGQRFIEGAGMAAEEWSTRYQPRDSEGHTIPLEYLPLGVTMLKREPAIGALTILGAPTGWTGGSRLRPFRCSPAQRTSRAPSRCSGSGRRTGRYGGGSEAAAGRSHPCSARRSRRGETSDRLKAPCGRPRTAA